MITQWKDLNPTQLLALKGYGGEQGIYVRASMLRALNGDGSAAIVLSQLIYWSQSDSARKNDGWFYLTTPHVTKTLGMSRYVQERVRKMLVEKGILEFERRGLPAKNWYRLDLEQVITLLSAEFYEDSDAPDQEGDIPQGENAEAHASRGESRHPDVQDSPGSVGGKSPERVNTLKNTPVKIYSKEPVGSTSGPAGASGIINVCGEKFDAGIKFILDTYPLSGPGLPVTEHQARRALKKLGDLKASHTPEEKQAAVTRVNEFKRAVLNIRQAVDSHDLETRFVPNFENFAGIKGILYGNEPGYLKWANRVAVAKPKPRLVV